MKWVTNKNLEPGEVVVHLDLNTYGLVRIMAGEISTGNETLDLLVQRYYEEVGCAPQDGFPQVNVARLLVDRHGGHILKIEKGDDHGIVY